MVKILEKVMKHCNNYFQIKKEGNDFTIENGKLFLKSKCVKGQYVLIKGSVLNDGVYVVKGVGDGYIDLEGIVDEIFTGFLFLLAVPRVFIKLVEEIEEFNIRNKRTNITSESFGNYSKSVATNENGSVETWKDVFKKELREFKKIYSGLDRGY